MACLLVIPNGPRDDDDHLKALATHISASTIRMTIAELCERGGFTQFYGPLGETARYELTSTR